MAKKNVDAVDNPNDGMKLDRTIGERIPDHEMMNPDDRRLDEAIGMKSSNRDGKKSDGATCENSSINGKLVGAMNFDIEKRLCARGSCRCENSGYGKRSFDSDNVKRSFNSDNVKRSFDSDTVKRFYIERSEDCENSGKSKKNFNSMKKLSVKGSCDCKYSDDSDGKRFCVRESCDGENSGDNKKNSDREKRFCARGNGDYERRRNSDSEKKFYVRGNCDYERRRNSCNNGCGREGNSTRRTTTTAEELATAASDQPVEAEAEQSVNTMPRMPRAGLHDINLTQGEDVCFNQDDEGISSTAAVAVRQRKFGGGVTAKAMTPSITLSDVSSSSRETLMNPTGTGLEGCDLSEEAREASRHSGLASGNEKLLRPKRTIGMRRGATASQQKKDRSGAEWMSGCVNPPTAAISWAGRAAVKE